MPHKPKKNLASCTKMPGKVPHAAAPHTLAHTHTQTHTHTHTPVTPGSTPRWRRNPSGDPRGRHACTDSTQTSEPTQVGQTQTARSRTSLASCEGWVAACDTAHNNKSRHQAWSTAPTEPRVQHRRGGGSWAQQAVRHKGTAPTARQASVGPLVHCFQRHALGGGRLATPRRGKQGGHQPTRARARATPCSVELGQHHAP
jgi:hypothetical protein